jgi:hypothetical protein
MPTLATVTRIDADTVGIKMHADEDSMLHGMFIPRKRGESLGDKPYTEWVGSNRRDLRTERFH